MLDKVISFTLYICMCSIKYQFNAVSETKANNSLDTFVRCYEKEKEGSLTLSVLHL